MMAKLPTRDSLPNVIPRSAGGFVATSEDHTSRAMQQLGNTITTVSDREKKQLDAMELARARSAFQTGLVQLKAGYNRQDNPDYDNWGGHYQANSTSLQRTAAGMISDRRLREQFVLETHDDRMRYGVSIGETARKHRNEDHATYAETAIETLFSTLGDPKTPNDVREDVYAKIGQTIKGLVDTGVISAPEGAKYAMENARRYAAIRIGHDMRENPLMAARFLTGDEPAGSGYLARLKMRESSGRADAEAEGSSAVGLYQFTSGTWKGLMEQHPELGLTIDGRKDPEQQERAVRQFTRNNARHLQNNNVPVTEATLRLAHFMGAGGAVKMVSTDGNAIAAEAFPDSAASNPRIFYVGGDKNRPRTVTEALAVITKGFSHEGAEIPEYYGIISPEDQLKLGAQAEAAAEKMVADEEADFILQQSREAIDHAMESFPDREEARAYVKAAIADPKAREDALVILARDYREMDKADEERRKKAEEDARVQIHEALEDGNNVTAAISIADKADVPPEVKKELQEMARAGVVTVDDSRIVDELDGHEFDGTIADIPPDKFRTMMFGLTPATRQKYMRLREAAEKGTGTGVDKSAYPFKPSQYVKTQLDALDLKDSGKDANPIHVRARAALERVIRIAVSAQEKQLGRPLSDTEFTNIVDQAVIERNRKTERASLSPMRLFSDSYEEERPLEKVMENIGETAQKLNITTNQLIDKLIIALGDDVPISVATIDAAYKIYMEDGGYSSDEKQGFQMPPVSTQGAN
jgi:hypothetical protein